MTSEEEEAAKCKSLKMVDMHPFGESERESERAAVQGWWVENGKSRDTHMTGTQRKGRLAE